MMSPFEALDKVQWIQVIKSDDALYLITMVAQFSSSKVLSKEGIWAEVSQ